MSDLKARLAELPKEPGVYFYKNAQGEIIYVGKAAVLRNRVRSYFVDPARLDNKTRVMVGEIAAIDWTTCVSEIDALFLESELIKRYMPKYNIELRDDKHYLYVKLTLNETAPTLSFVRRPLDDGATYFGPFVSGWALRKALRYLRKIFPYNTHTVLPKRVCLQYHLGLCPGLEEGKTSLGQYRKNLSKLVMFLKGQRKLLVKQIEKEMRVAAAARDFERAALLRNQAQDLKALGKQIVFSDQERFDISRDQALNGLVELLGLKGTPRRIEAYDISHISGSSNVASMIVFMDGVPAKSEYRRFKMNLAGNDDFAHMREVISRRFRGRNLEKWPKPDLLVIDGGKGQLAAAGEALERAGLDIPALGLAKRLEQVIRPASGGSHALNLPKTSHVLQLLMRMRDEAHRFAVTYHALLRSRRQTASLLDEVPGIGPATRKKLIKHFGSFAGIKRAGLAELAKVVGERKAKALQQQL